MALQIGRIKASRRQILPELTPSIYKKTVGESGKTSYRRIIKSEKRTKVYAGGKERIHLENKALAKRTARQRQGSAIPPEKVAGWINKPSNNTGMNLKKGIIGMAKKSGISDSELFRKINDMDESKLQLMYDRDELIFDVAFTYNEDGSFGDKESDLAYLVDTYEALFGAIE